MNLWRRKFSEFTKRYLGKQAVLAKDCFIGTGSTVIGSVEIGSNSSIWYNCVLRGDINSIRIGNRSNIQDGTVVHVTRRLPVEIGDDVSVGHNVTLHGCRIGHNTLVGMGSVIMDDVSIEPNSIVGAGSVLTPGKQFPANSLILGAPARRVRDLTSAELQSIKDNADRYCVYAKDHIEFQNKAQ